MGVFTDIDQFVALNYSQAMNNGSFLQLTASTAQLVLRQFTVKRHSDVAQTLLTSDRSVYDSFVDRFGKQTEDVSTLTHQLESLPDYDVMAWILAHDHLDLNSKQFQHKISINVPILVELFIQRFSPECILKLVQDARFCPKGLQDAVLFYFSNENEVFLQDIASLTWKNPFLQYVAAASTSDAMSDLIGSILSRIAINKYNTGSDKIEGDVIHVEETLLQMTLKHFLTNSYLQKVSSKRANSCGSTLMLLITHLLKHPDTDINLENSEGESTIEYLLLTHSATSINKSLSALLEKFAERSDLNEANSSKLLRSLLRIELDYAKFFLNKPVDPERRSVIMQKACMFLDKLSFSEEYRKVCLLELVCAEVPFIQMHNFDYLFEKMMSICLDINAVLLESERNERFKNCFGQTVLMILIDIRDVQAGQDLVVINKCIDLILAHPKLDVNVRCGGGATALSLAIDRCMKDIVQLLLNREDIDMNTSETPISRALDLFSDTTATTQCMLEILQMVAIHPRLKNLDVQNRSTNNTALHVFIENRKYDVIDAMISKAKQDTSVLLSLKTKNRDGETAFDWMIDQASCDAAKSTGNKKQLRNIFQKALELPNAIVNGKFKYGRTLLHKCAQRGVTSFIDTLMTFDDLDVNAQDDNGLTPVMLAVESGDIDVTTQFLQNPVCDVKMKTKAGENLRDVATKLQSQQPELYRLVDVVYTRSATSPSVSVLLSDVSVEDQLKFLRQSVQRHDGFSQTLKDDVTTQLDCVLSDIAQQMGGKFGATTKMSELHRKKLLCLRAFLCDEIIPAGVLFRLWSDDVITDDLREDIEQLTTRRQKCVRLLTVLPLLGSRAYDSLIKALRADNQSHVADEIERFDPYAQTEDTTSQDLVMRPDQLVFPPSGGEPYAIVPLRFLHGGVVTPVPGSHVIRRAPALGNDSDDIV